MSIEHCGVLVSRRVTWSPEETKDLINLIGKNDVSSGKMTNAEAYQQVSDQMRLLGHKKTPDQCKIKWKHLKNFYYEARRKTTDREKFMVCPFYNEIRDAIGTAPSLSHAKFNFKDNKRKFRMEKYFSNSTPEEQTKPRASDAKLEDSNSRSRSDANGNIKTESKLTNEKSPLTVQISSSVTLSACPTVKSDQQLTSTTKHTNSDKCQHQPAICEDVYCSYKPTVILERIDNEDFTSRYLYDKMRYDDIKPRQAATPILNSLYPEPFPNNWYSDHTPEVCIKWNSYQFNMQNTLPTLLEGDKFVDVTLACEGRFLKCHKLILSACSLYFDELLSQATSQYPIIFMKDMKFWQIQAIVEFMYRGEVNIAQERLPALLAAAESLRVKGLAAPTNPNSTFDKNIYEEAQSFDFDSRLVSNLLPSTKRGRKRKHQFDGETIRGKLKQDYERYDDDDAGKTNKENFSAEIHRVDNDESYFSNTQYKYVNKGNKAESKSCITTIILPDHNYQQSTACKLQEYNHDQQHKQNLDSNNQKEDDEFESDNLDAGLVEKKNHQDHIYSKPQKEIREQRQNDSNISEEDISIHDNTIFYSYLQIDDSSPNKT